MSLKVVLKQALLVLNQIHVSGAEAGALYGVMKNIEACIRAIEENEKGAEKNADGHDKQE